jgi:flagellar protein FlgJ
LSPAVLVAQAALEVAGGKRVIKDADGNVTHNLFGIKADPRWEGPKAVVSTLEYEQGVASRQKAAFRSYESFEESFNDYVDFLTSGSRYKGRWPRWTARNVTSRRCSRLVMPPIPSTPET